MTADPLDDFADRDDDLPTAPDTREVLTSQVPAIHLLTNLGWTLLPPGEAEALRDSPRSPILTGLLKDWLAKNNRIDWKGTVEPFSRANVDEAVRRLDDAAFPGLQVANAARTERLLLGTTLTQTVAGDTKSFPLRYIDWRTPANNALHVVPEFRVRKSGGDGDVVTDLVLFVNGIPLGTAECKCPAAADARRSAVDKAVHQTVRNWGVAYAPRLFGFVQMTLALAQDEAKYGTAGTEPKYWAVWRERDDAGLPAVLAEPPTSDTIKALKASLPAMCKGGAIPTDAELSACWASDRLSTGQDETLWGLCRPDRFAALCGRYTLVDGGVKKIARHQQFFCVRRLLERVEKRNPDGSRRGGVVWHTQGSGKSLTMVMFARALAEELPRAGTNEFKVVLVTDRVDLDRQIGATFAACGVEVIRAKTGRHLSGLLADGNSRVITTVVDKFKTAAAAGEPVDDSEVFVLVDEGHRSHYTQLHALMMKTLPRACLLAFTGTPVRKNDRDTVDKFGGIVDTYTLRDANEDRAVVPLIYEGRDIPQTPHDAAVDQWFDRYTRDLNAAQRTDLKAKYGRAEVVLKAKSRLASIAWDVNEHYRRNWQGTGFKAQLVADSRASAVRLKQSLDEFGDVRAEVLISPPDDREGEDGAETETPEDTAVVRTFWKTIEAQYRNAEAYQEDLIARFKTGPEPEVLIVVSKLLTGFDAPRNTVLYLARKMDGHNLLQAIARVNRLADGKDAGYVLDYVGVMEALDEAIREYDQLAGGDADDAREAFKEAVVLASEEAAKLPGLHADLWGLFRDVLPVGAGRSDEPVEKEPLARHLADRPTRDGFYAKLSHFTRVLGLALSTVAFHEETPTKKLRRYKRDLAFFQELRREVQRRYGEKVAFAEYGGRIKKVIDDHVGAGEAEVLVEPLPLLDDERREAELARLGSDAAKADAIVAAVTRTISERKRDDPARYRKFSELLRQVIAEWRAGRVSDAQYLDRVREQLGDLNTGARSDVPADLRDREVAQAFYGSILDVLKHAGTSDAGTAGDFAVAAATAVDDLIGEEPPVDWVKNDDHLNRLRQQIDDALFDLKDEYEVTLTLDEMDRICSDCLEIAKRRRTR